MAISYDKLNILLAEKGLKRTDLLNVLSSKTLAKLNKNEVITTETIDKICLFLDCQPNDIMEVYKNTSEYPVFDIKKYIFMPNGDNTYTAVQRKLFRMMEKEELISKEKINYWLENNEMFRESYNYKK